jgi:hypothetical protein
MTSSKNDSERVIEVRELTDILRSDLSFETIRKDLESKGNDWRASYLAGLIEGEEGVVRAVVVDSECQVWFFRTDDKDHIVEWRKVRDIPSLNRYFGAVLTAVELMKSEREK